MQTIIVNAFKIILFKVYFIQLTRARAKDWYQELTTDPLNFFVDTITVLYVGRSALAGAFSCKAFWWPLWIESIAVVQLIKGRDKTYHRELAATAEKIDSWVMVAPDTSPEQTKDCIDAVSDVTFLLKETLVVWEIIQTSVMSTNPTVC